MLRDTYIDQTQWAGYSPGHPWYYVLGGDWLRPKQILENVRRSGYGGYLMDELQTANGLAEPRRSEKLRLYRERFISELRRDLSGYRNSIRKLREHHQLTEILSEPKYADIHTSVSLKHNHLVNDFAHLIMLDELIPEQLDLFV